MVDLRDPSVTAAQVIAALELKPHPEGGHFREIWRDAPADGSRGAGTAIYFLLVKLFSPAEIAVEGWTSLFLAITFFGGLSAFMLGIVLQYLSSMILKVHGKPTFFTIDRSGDATVARWLEQHPDPRP